MKKIVCLLFSFFALYAANAQSGDARVDALIHQMQKPAGQFSFTFNGQKSAEKVSLIKTPKGFYAIMGSLETSTPIAFKIPQLATGKYDLADNDNVLSVNGKVYLFRGTISLVVAGAKTKGTLTGNLFEIKGKKAKAELTSSGTITGTFSGLSNP
jgi:hypothetical protein